jgi:tripartite ATP-independent transporter DctM subunit
MAGGIIERGRIGEVLVNWVMLFLGKVKGSLGVVGVVASAVFSSICGSGAATISCIGSILAPQMKKKGYPMGKCAAIVCCAGPLGLVLPPSATQILVAWVGGLSVLACFLAIVFPGLLLVGFLSVGAFLLLKAHNIIEKDAVPSGQFLRELGKRTFTAIPALIMPVIILGGIYGGFMTPTEAAGISVFYAIPVGMFIYRGMNLRGLGEAFVKTATTTGVIMVMIGVAVVFSNILLRQGMATALMEMLLDFSENRIVIMFMINLMMLLLAAIMDDVSATLICVPMLLPVIRSIGVNPYQFAAILGVNIAMGNITPPTAPFVFLAARIFNVEVSEMMKPVALLLIFCHFPVLMITTYVPQLSLWLPTVIMGAERLL